MENLTLNTNPMEFTQSTSRVEIQKDKMSTFDSMVKKMTRLSKFMNFPAPIVTNIGEKIYYKLGYIKIDGGYETIGEITDNWDLIKHQKVQEQEKIKNKPNGDSNNVHILSTIVNLFDVTLVSELKPKDEWSILGVIDHKEGLIKSAPNKQVPTHLIPKDLVNDAHCDHCNKSIRRNKSVYIQNGTDDKIIRVGGSCIQYYLGVNFENVLEYVTALSLFMNSIKQDNSYSNFGFGGDFNSEPIMVDTKETLKYFVGFSKMNGYISKSSAENINSTKESTDKMVSPTKNIIFENSYYVNNPNFNYKLSHRELEEELKNHQVKVEKYNKIVSTQDDAIYDKFVEFINNNYIDNNFLYNVKSMVDNKCFPLNHLNYFVGACSMFYGKLLYDELKAKSDIEKNTKLENDRLTSNWIGEVGQKLVIKNLEIINVSGFSGTYGWTNVYKLKDESGNIYTKFGVIPEKFITNDKNCIEVGTVVSAQVEINKHDTYKEVKQTVLGRFSNIPKK